MSDERQFLHDIASPLTIMQLNLQSAITMLQNSKAPGQEGCLKALQSSLEQTNRISGLVHKRREKLIEESEK